MRIKIEKNRRSIQIRFSLGGQKYRFSPLKKSDWTNPQHRKICEGIAQNIELDILRGAFDPSLESYRHNPNQKNCSKIAAKLQSKSWLQIFLGWQESLGLPDQTRKDHYFCLQRQIEKAGNPELKNFGWFVDSDLATSTFNRRLSMLRSAVAWALSEGIINFDPLKGIKSRKSNLEEQEKIEANRKPFSLEEIEMILNYFKNNYPSYFPFVEFLLFSGVRTGEAIGLRWCDIDLNKKIINIKQNIVRERGGYKKIKKLPKTRQATRSFMMSDRLYDLFLNLENNSVKELVFLSPDGEIIDHGNFRSKYWKPALDNLGIPYRKPYCTRHTLLSHAIESGLNPIQTAALAGHKNAIS